jgi:hypothetical protein
MFALRPAVVHGEHFFFRVCHGQIVQQSFLALAAPRHRQPPAAPRVDLPVQIAIASCTMTTYVKALCTELAEFPRFSSTPATCDEIKFTAVNRRVASPNLTRGANPFRSMRAAEMRVSR